MGWMVERERRVWRVVMAECVVECAWWVTLLGLWSEKEAVVTVQVVETRQEVLKLLSYVIEIRDWEVV